MWYSGYDYNRMDKLAAERRDACYGIVKEHEPEVYESDMTQEEWSRAKSQSRNTGYEILTVADVLRKSRHSSMQNIGAFPPYEMRLGEIVSMSSRSFYSFDGDPDGCMSGAMVYDTYGATR